MTILLAAQTIRKFDIVDKKRTNAASLLKLTNNDFNSINVLLKAAKLTHFSK